MSGAGFCAAGTSPAGWGDIDPAPVPSANFRVDQFGVKQVARRIDPTTQNYVYDQFGAVQGMSQIQQQVYLAVKTVLNESALANFGRRRTSRIVTPTLVQQLTNDVNDALAFMVTRKLIAILSVQVVKNAASQFVTLVKFRDLTQAALPGQSTSKSTLEMEVLFE